MQFYDIVITCLLLSNIRQYITESILVRVMCGVMELYYMKYGAWDVNHMSG